MDLCLLTFLLVLLASTFASGQSASDQSRDASDANGAEPSAPMALLNANTLQMTGKPPFHLRASLEIKDTKGQPFEKASLEYWWAGSAGAHLDLSAPSFGTVHNTRLDTLPNDTARRSVFLAAEWLSEFLFPGRALGPDRAQAQTEPVAFGPSVLDCLHVLPFAGASATTEVCADRQTQTIRLTRGRHSSIARNHTASFGQTRVALDISITYAHLEIITGHVEQLEGFNPAKVNEKLETTGVLLEGAGRSALPAKMSGSMPEYPRAAREERSQGSLFLGAQVSEEGKVEYAFPITSLNPLLVGAALTALRGSTFQPTVVDGKPERRIFAFEVTYTMSAGRS